MKRLALPKSPKVTLEILTDLYTVKKFSVAQIAKQFNCSENRINYWFVKYGIKKRTIADAIYQLKNPQGDPFLLKQPQTLEDGILFGMGLGLYWGEGEKRGNRGVRITNSDPRLLKKFIEFLVSAFSIDKSRLRFGLQVFSDASTSAALDYWRKELGVKKEQFYKVIVSPSRGVGTYKYKSSYGVVVVYFNNVKLKRLICSMIENIQ